MTIKKQEKEILDLYKKLGKLPKLKKKYYYDLNWNGGVIIKTHFKKHSIILFIRQREVLSNIFYWDRENYKEYMVLTESTKKVIEVKGDFIYE